MARQPTIRDPVLGVLQWHSGEREWRSTVAFTPKHDVTVSLYGPANLHRSPRRDEELAPARAAFLLHRQREWEYRLHLAEILLMAKFVAPDSDEAVARRLRLGEIDLDLDGTGAWRFSVQTIDDEDLAIRVALSADALVDVEF